MSLYIDTKCAIHYQWCIVSSRYLAVDIMISENIPANYEEIWVVARNLPTQKMGNGYFLYGEYEKISVNKILLWLEWLKAYKIGF